MALKLTFETEMKGAKEVERYLADWTKRLNESGAAGEKMSKHINDGLKAITDSLETLTKSGTGLNSITKSIDELGGSLDKNLGASKKILIDSLQDGLKGLEKESKRINQEIAESTQKMHAARSRYDKKAEDKHKSAMVQGTLEQLSVDKQIGHYTEKLRTALADPKKSDQQSAFSNTDRSILSELTSSFKNFARNPMGGLVDMFSGAMSSSTDLHGTTAMIGRHFSQMAAGGGAGGMVGNAGLGFMRNMGAMNAVGQVGFAAYQGLQAFDEIHNVAPLRAKSARRERRWGIATRAATGQDISVDLLGALGTGTTYDLEEGNLTSETVAMQAKRWGTTALRSGGGDLLNTVGQGMLATAAALMFVPGVGWVTSAALAAGGGAMMAAGAALYKDPGEIEEAMKKEAIWRDIQKYKLVSEETPKFVMERGQMLHDLQRNFGRTAVNRGIGSLNKRGVASLSQLAGRSKELSRYGVMANQDTLKYMFESESLGVTTGAAKEIGASLSLRETGGQYTRMQEEQLRAAGLHGAGNISARGELWGAVNEQLEGKYISDTNVARDLINPIMEAIGLGTESSRNADGTRSISATEVANAGASAGNISFNREKAPGSLNIRMLNLLQQHGVVNPMMADMYIKEGLRRDDIIKKVLQEGGREATPENIDAFKADYYRMRKDEATTLSQQMGLDLSKEDHRKMLNHGMGMSLKDADIAAKLGIGYASQLMMSPADFKTKKEGVRQGLIDDYLKSIDVDPTKLEKGEDGKYDVSTSGLNEKQLKQLEVLRNDDDFFKTFKVGPDGKITADTDMDQIEQGRAAKEQALTEGIVGLEAKLGSLEGEVTKIIAGGFVKMANDLSKEFGELMAAQKERSTKFGDRPSDKESTYADGKIRPLGGTDNKQPNESGIPE